MFSFVTSRLWLHLMVWISGVVTLVLAVVIYSNILAQRDLSSRQMAMQNTMLAGAVEGGMFDALASGDNDVVRGQFKRLHTTLPGLKVFVYDFNGKISFSTDPEGVGDSVRSHLGEGPAMAVETMMVENRNPEGIVDAVLDDRQFGLVSRVIPNEERCFHCHGSSRAVLGGITVGSSEDEIMASIDISRNRSILLGVSGIAGIILLVWFLFHTLVNRKISILFKATRMLRLGDFTGRIEVRGNDEISHILARINLVNENLTALISRVIDESATLSRASTGLGSISKALLETSTATASNAHAVSAAAEELSSNLNSIAAAMEETTSNLSMVAEASVEMNDTVNEISRNAGVARSILTRSVQEFTQVGEVVDELGSAASEVDQVTDEIRSIADQVSLLALNAKIEAARAGEAGKGFAVVAQEITELAAQAAGSTLKVDERLRWMQDKAGHTASGIKQLTTTVMASDDAVSAIAEAVDRQSVTTGEISGRIAQVAEGVAMVNENVAQGALAAQEMAKEIAAIDGAAGVMDDNSSQVNENALSLSRMADELQEMMKKFTV